MQFHFLLLIFLLLLCVCVHFNKYTIMHCGQLGLTEITGGSNSGATVRLAATLRHHAWWSTPLQNASLLAFATVIFYFGFIFDVSLFYQVASMLLRARGTLLAASLHWWITHAQTHTHTHSCMRVYEYLIFFIYNPL